MKVQWLVVAVKGIACKVQTLVDHLNNAYQLAAGVAYHDFASDVDVAVTTEVRHYTQKIHRRCYYFLVAFHFRTSFQLSYYHRSRPYVTIGYLAMKEDSFHGASAVKDEPCYLGAGNVAGATIASSSH